MRLLYHALIALLLTGCTTYNPRYTGTHWIFEECVNCAACCRTSHAYYPPHYPCGSLSVELIKDAACLRMYLNLLLVPVCPEELFSDCLAFDVTIDGIPLRAHATVLEGGQRLLLDEQTMNRFIEAFLLAQTIHIRVGMHSGDVCSEGFKNAYEAIMNSPR